MLKILCLILLFFCRAYCLPTTSYLHLDNQTTATLDDVLDDPFLVIRTKAGGPQEAMDWVRSWQAWAELELKDEFPSSAKETSFFEILKNNESPRPKVIAQPCCDDAKPYFAIDFNGKEMPRVLWWQISGDPEFHSVIPNLNIQLPFTEIIRLSELEETFLNPNKTYYFRVCTEDSSWSTACHFQAQKPDRVPEVMFSKINDRLYELSWEPLSSPSTTYLIFASNAFDFVPSIYFEEQLNILYKGKALETESTQNLICETKQSSVLISGDFAFYRIIASDQGRLSVPSPLVYIFDDGLLTPRTQLKQDSFDPFLFKRQTLSSTYESRDQLNFLIEKVPTYLYNPLVPKTLWETLKPYFLPINHPIKGRLDRLFQRNRITQSEDSFEKGGFGKPKMRQPTNIVIGRNPHFKDYIFKVYLDTQPFVNEWENWVKRIEGARTIQACIKRHGFRHFITPAKWIYPLPEEPSPPFHSIYQRKNFILIVENMNILHSKENLKAFKKKMTSQILKELYIILTEEGLIDSVYPDNIPFTKKGQMAFIDTEHYHLAPVQYHKLTRFFSPEMQLYWQSLQKN
jgi:hypothetical protein